MLEPLVEVPTRTLVHALLRRDGTVAADELYEVAGLLAMSDQQVRLSIKRLVAAGEFEVVGRGRRAVLRAAADLRRALGAEVRFVGFAYRQDRGLEPWDGRWHLVAFAVPEAERQSRDALRREILYLGGAPVQGGLYVSANAWEPLIDEAVRRLGGSATVTTATTRDLAVAGERDPRRLAARLWPVAEIAQRWTRLAVVAGARLAHLDAHPDLGRGERLRFAIEVATLFDEAAQPDPLLPPELLPDPWPGAEGRALAARCWARLATQDDGQHRIFTHYDGAIPDLGAG
ncbi:PaaX family transcriptional regulator C-terminal domain-containing protein [Micromonospora sp. KC606]|uniref:PaaX family transcriptional regulator C-terminal domain-containing protein n=1 Tax=Micromonospora sp. KC606 TaxID=2530379 RepID=UPI001A9DF788|nr:PaaX family transcriptional regulator C-terminal domain-containing protein [Micromonospora sp. KC606]